MYVCEVCRAKYRRHRELVSHLTINHPSKKSGYLCGFRQQCSMRLSSLSDLKHHVAALHKKKTLGSLQPSTLIVSEVLIRCKQESCMEFVASSRQNFYKHLREVHEHEKKKCHYDTCSYKTDTIQNLRRHLSSMHRQVQADRASRFMQPVQESGAPDEEEFADAMEEDYGDEDGQNAETEDVVMEENGDDFHVYLKNYAHSLNQQLTNHFVPFGTICENTLQISRQCEESDARQKRRVLKALRDKSKDEGLVDSVMASFSDSDLKKAASHFSSPYRLMKFNEENFHHVKIERIEIDGKQNNAAYISIKESLAKLLLDNNISAAIQEGQKVAPRSENQWNDIVDGDNFKANKFFQENPNALKIHMYSDVVNITNPLGASKTKHKILMVYWTLLDFPKEVRSKADSFFIALAAREKQSKSFEDDLFRPLLKDLEDLEAGVIVNGELIKAGIVVYSGDNLEAHNIGGFQTNFNAGYICRFCELQYKDLQLHPVDECPLRTEEKYDNIALRFRPQQVPDINVLESTPQDLLSDEITNEETHPEDDEPAPLAQVEDELAPLESCGLKKACLFNKLQSFHAVRSLPPDAFHDVMEGGVSVDILQLLKFLMKSGVFSLSQLNTRITSLNYTFSDASDAPQPLPKNCDKLPGKGVANMVFMRLLPFILNPWAEKIPAKIMHLILAIHKFLEVTLSFSFNRADIELYREDIEDYFALRREFSTDHPGVLSNLKPKHHYILHYPDMVEQHGPLRMYWTLRFEAKHRLVINIMEAAKNFKNSPATIAYRGQLRTATALYGGIFNLDGLEAHGKQVSGSELSRSDPFFPFKESGDIITKLQIHGTQYLPGMIIVKTAPNDSEAEVGRILNTFIRNENPYAFVEMYRVSRTEHRFFSVDESLGHSCIALRTLRNFEPLVPYGSPKNFIFFMRSSPILDL